MRASHSLNSDSGGHTIDFSEEEGSPYKESLAKFSEEDLDYLQDLGEKLKGI